MKEFIKREDASVIAMTAAALAVAVVITTATIAMSTYESGRSKLQTALDNALLSAIATTGANGCIQTSATTGAVTPVTSATGGCSAVWTATQQFLVPNLPTSLTVTSLSVGTGPTAYEWQASATATISSPFGNASLAPTSVTRTSVVAWDASSSVEVAFALNMSTSMCLSTSAPDQQGNMNFASGVASNGTCTKLENMKSALTNILSTGFIPLQNSSGNPVYKIGIIPFNDRVRLPNPTNIPTVLSGTESASSAGSKTYYTTDTFNPAATLSSSTGYGISTGVDSSAALSDPVSYPDASSNRYWIPMPPVIPLVPINSTADLNNLVTYVTSIQQYYTGNGWVRSNIGALTAGLVLDPTYYSNTTSDTAKTGKEATFPTTPVTTPASPTVTISTGSTYGNLSFAPSTPSAFGGSTQKAVVLMTDGSNIGCCYGYQSGNSDTNTASSTASSEYLYPYEVDNVHLFGLQNYQSFTPTAAISDTDLTNTVNIHSGSYTPPSGSTATAATLQTKYGIPGTSDTTSPMAIGLCQTLKNSGVRVYTVLFDVNDSDFNGAGKDIANIYQSCATSSQYFFRVNSASDLQQVYKSIAQSFIQLRIVQ